MDNFRLSVAATEDLESIWNYIAQGNLEIAGQFVFELTEHFILLGDFKLIGVSRENLRPGLRCLPYGRYLIFYYPLKNGVEISRVIHSARDIETIFASDYEN